MTDIKLKDIQAYLKILIKKAERDKSPELLIMGLLRIIRQLIPLKTKMVENVVKSGRLRLILKGKNGWRIQL